MIRPDPLVFSVSVTRPDPTRGWTRPVVNSGIDTPEFVNPQQSVCLFACLIHTSHPIHSLSSGIVDNLIASEDALDAQSTRIDRSPAELCSSTVDRLETYAEVGRNIQRH